MTLADKLRPHVKAIMDDAAAGNDRAAEIVTLYGMHQRCPGDPAAPSLCEAAFNEWKRTRSNNTN